MQIDFTGRRIAVIGDVMLDIYLDGAVSRISPEAPVPVLRFERERMVAGGAANVAANIASLGGAVRAVGMIGSDSDGTRLARLLAQEMGIDVEGIVVDPARATTTKTRLVAGRHQMMRLDRERVGAGDASLQAALIAGARRAIDWAELVVVSDYGKGVLSDEVLAAVFAAAAETRKPVIADPKRPDAAAYRGATYLTPNRRELELATGMPCIEDEEAAAAARRLIEIAGATVIHTRSERGMALFAADAPPIFLETKAREVFDVSGAGDTVVAVLALALAAGHVPVEAMRLANVAAGLVVAKAGTATLSHHELEDALLAEAHPEHFLDRKTDQPANRGTGRGVPVPLDTALQIRRSWRRRGFQVGFTNGCFDILHPGHVSLIEQAAAECDRLIVALNTDRSVAALKGPSRPIQSERARARVIGALSGVDMVVLFDDATPLALIRALVPDVLIKGADYRPDQVVGADIVVAEGGRVVLADLVAGQSTTAIVRKATGRGC